MSDARDTVHACPGRSHDAASWRHEIAELAALFIAVGLAHLLATLLGHSDPGPVVLISLGVALIGSAKIHKRLAARRAQSPQRAERSGLTRPSAGGQPAE